MADDPAILKQAVMTAFRFSGRPHVVVGGGRNWSDVMAVEMALKAISQRHRNMVIMHGLCRTGVDAIAAQWCFHNDVPTVAVCAQYRAFGEAALPIRNQKLLDWHTPIGAVLFPGGDGTHDLRLRLIAAKVPIWNPKGINDVTTKPAAGRSSA